MPVEEEIKQLFLTKGWTLSLAESCTGGSIAARLTRVSGASQYFLGSMVVYSNELKMKLLGIPEQLIKDKGAVSEEVVIQMALGALALAGSDCAVAVSGIAGPSGGTPEKPVGTIWGAIAKRGEKPHAWKFHLKGQRDAIIEQSVDLILQELARSIKLRL